MKRTACSTKKCTKVLKTRDNIKDGKSTQTNVKNYPSQQPTTCNRSIMATTCNRSIMAMASVF